MSSGAEQIVRYLWDCFFQSSDFEAIAKLLSSNFVLNIGGEEIARGPDAAKTWFRTLHGQSGPKPQFNMEDCFQNQDGPSTPLFSNSYSERVLMNK